MALKLGKAKRWPKALWQKRTPIFASMAVLALVAIAVLLAVVATDHPPSRVVVSLAPLTSLSTLTLNSKPTSRASWQLGHGTLQDVTIGAPGAGGFFISVPAPRANCLQLASILVKPRDCSSRSEVRVPADLEMHWPSPARLTVPAMSVSKLVISQQELPGSSGERVLSLTSYGLTTPTSFCFSPGAPTSVALRTGGRRAKLSLPPKVDQLTFSCHSGLRLGAGTPSALTEGSTDFVSPTSLALTASASDFSFDRMQGTVDAAGIRSGVATAAIGLAGSASKGHPFILQLRLSPEANQLTVTSPRVNHLLLNGNDLINSELDRQPTLWGAIFALIAAFVVPFALDQLHRRKQGNGFLATATAAPVPPVPVAVRPVPAREVQTPAAETQAPTPDPSTQPAAQENRAAAPEKKARTPVRRRPRRPRRGERDR